MQITIYTKSGCVNCDRAKQLLKSKRLEFTAVDADTHPEILYAMMEQHPEVRQMPQIFIDGQRVGGLAGLQAALKQVGL